jgi:hypothetical protein
VSRKICLEKLLALVALRLFLAFFSVVASRQIFPLWERKDSLFL